MKKDKNRKVRILVAEDEAIVAKDLQDMLTEMGYEVLAVADTGKGVFKKAKQLRPDLIIMDIMLNGDMDGIDAAKLIKSQFDIPFIYLTAYADEEKLKRSVASAPYAYILKPFKEKELQIAIQIALYKHQAEMRESKGGDDLRASELLHRDFIENSNEMIQSILPDGTFNFVNREWHKVMGYSREDLRKIKLWDIIHPSCIAHCQGKFRQVMEGKSVKGLEAVFIKKDGGLVNVIGSSSPQMMNGKVIATQGFFMDITEEKRIRQALRESELKHRTLFETAGDAIFLMRHDRFIDCNARTLTMFGCKREQIIGAHPYFRFSPLRQPDGRPSKEKAIEKINKALKEGPQSFEWEHRRLDKTPFAAEVSLNRIEFGGEVFLQAIVRDITERKKTEAEIQKLSERQKSILGTVPDIIMEVDKNKVYTWANQAGYDFFGKNVIGKEASYYFEGDQKTYDIVKPIFSGQEKTVYVESWQRRKDGQKRLLAWWCRPLKNKDGKLMGSLSSARDITEERKATETVADLARFPGENPNPIIRIRFNDGVLYSNAPGKKLLKQLGGSIPKELKAKIQKAFRTNRALNTELEAKGQFYFVSVVPFRKSGYINLYGRDVTEWKKAENALHESEKRYRLLFASMQNGFALHEIILDKSGKPYDYRFIEVNPAFEAITGLKASKIIGKTAREVLPGTENVWIETYGKVALTGKPAHLENYSSELGRYYDVQAYCPKPGYFATLVADVTQRKKDEELIKTSEAKFRTVIENIQDIVLSVGIDGKVNFVTPNVRQFGYSAEEILGQSFIQFLFPDDVEMMVAEFGKAIKKGYGEPQIFRLLKKDGTPFWVEESTRVVRKNGKYVGLIGTIRDISERKKAEVEMLWKSALLEAQINATVEGILIVDEKGNKVIQNQRCIDLWKIPKHIVKNHDDKKQVEFVMNRAKDPQKFADKILYLYAHPNEISHDEVEFKDGMILERYSAPVIGKDGTHFGRIWTFIDVTKQRKAEVQLQKSHDELENRVNERTSDLAFANAFLKMELENSLDGILIVDTQGKFIAENQRFVEMWKVPKAVIQTRNDKKLLNHVISQLQDPDEFLHEVKRLYPRKHERTRGLVTFKDGRVFDRYSAPLTGEDGKYYGRLWSFRDMSKEAEINKAKNEFVALASHQLRTPLTGTKWIIQVVLERGGLTGWQTEFLQDALKSNERMITLVNDLLNISRLDAGVIGYVPKQIELVGFLSNVIDEVSKDERAKDLKIILRPAVPEMFVSLDPTLTRQVVVNLLMNAVKYSAGGKNVIISARKLKEIVEISVKDRGIGISKEDQSKLFDKFFRSATAERIDTKGSGLGLYIIKKILKVCHGQIVCQSALGKGSVFTVTLPLRGPKKVKGQRELIPGVQS